MSRLPCLQSTQQSGWSGHAIHEAIACSNARSQAEHKLEHHTSRRDAGLMHNTWQHSVQASASASSDRLCKALSDSYDNMLHDIQPHSTL